MDMLNQPTMDKKLKDAVDTLIAALSEDKSEGSYYYGWQSSIAMAFFDEVRNHCDNSASASAPNYEISKERLHFIANNAAKNFLNILCCKPEPNVDGYVKGDSNA